MYNTEQIIERIRDIHGSKYDYSKFVYNGMHNKSIIICPEHGEFLQTPHSHLKGQGCPKCGIKSRIEKRQYDTEIFIKKAKEVHNNKYNYSKVRYIDSKTDIIIICPEHGEFIQKPYLHLQKHGCPFCYNKQRGNSLKMDFELFKEKLYKIYGNKYNFDNYNYINYNTREQIICKEHGVFYRSPFELLKGKECPVCMKRERKVISKVSNFKKFLTKAKEIHGDKYDYSKVKYNGSYNPIEIICQKHGSFFQKPTYHLCGNGCPICANETIKSTAEIQIEEFLKTLNIKFVKNARSIIYPYELDIYIEDKQIAIEYDGLYWHNELNKDKNYHLNKTKLCEEKGIRLIHIFEDEWIYKEDIVKSRLKAILGTIDRKIYARKCKIKELIFKETKEFLENNHIQGNCLSKYRYGLYYNNELVSVMTFGSKRRNLGSKSEDDTYELLRFCNKTNTMIIGGASKLLKHFINELKPLKIISYCDRRWSNGNLYEKLGFRFNHHSQPNYFYVKNDKRLNRFNFRKDILVKEGFSKDKTEHQIMMDRNIYRIYDCGSSLYVYETSNTEESTEKQQKVSKKRENNTKKE